MMASAILLSSRLRVKNKLKTAYVGLGVMGIAVLFCGLLPSSLIACWLFIFACAFIGGGGNIHTIDPQEYIADLLVEKLFSQVGQRHRDACEIIVGYLVKRCDLFNENTKQS